MERALHFSPGFLIGLILGLTIQERSAASYAWRTIVLRTSIVLLMAIAAWIGYSTLTLVVFVLAVIPWEGNWDALHGSLGVWIIVLGAFAATCVGVYIYFRRFAPPFEAEDADEEVPLGETVARDHTG